MQYTRKVKMLGEEPKEPNLVTIDLGKFAKLMRGDFTTSQSLEVINKIEQCYVQPKQELKPVEFVKFINGVGESSKPSMPSDWERIELICKKYRGGDFDLLLAYGNGRRDTGCLYLGHLNDGVY